MNGQHRLHVLYLERSPAISPLLQLSFPARSLLGRTCKSVQLKARQRRSGISDMFMDDLSRYHLTI